LRILLVISGMHPRSGGPPAVVAGSARALANLGHEVSVLSTSSQDEEALIRSTWSKMLDAGVHLELCREDGLRGFLGNSPSRPLVRKMVEGTDIVHLHGVWNPIFLRAAREADDLGKPYFVSVHGVFDRRAMERVKTKWVKKRVAVALFGYRSFLEGAAGVVFGSEAESRQSWLPSKEMCLTFLPNGVDSESGKSDPTTQDLERLRASVPETADWQRIILCRSRIHEEKGIDMLVQAFHQVMSDYPDARLLIAGIRQDLTYEKRIVDLIDSSPEPGRVVLTTEFVGESSQFLYKVGHIFAMPSIAEGFSVALVEGLAHGRPMLLTRYCHMQIVEDAGGGVVVDPTVESLTEGLRSLLAKSPEDLESMGCASRRLFEDRYTWERVADCLSDEYHQAVKQSTGL